MPEDEGKISVIEELVKQIYRKLNNGMDDSISQIREDIKDLREDINEIKDGLRLIKWILLALAILLALKLGLSVVSVFAQMNNAQIIYMPR